MGSGVDRSEATARTRATARAASIAAVVSLFLLAAALCLTRVTDTDLWWHLATGDLIRATGDVPRSEPFSYTVLGHRWVDVHWLFQVALSFLYGLGGMGALTALKALLVLGLLSFLYARGRRLAGPGAVVAVLLLATLACQERFLMRPEIVSWLLLALALAAIERALDEERIVARRRILWVVLPLVQVLWVNVQGLFMIGPVMLALALLASLAWPRRSDFVDRTVDLLVSLAIVSGACLFNPYGALALRLPIDQLLRHLGGRTLLSRTIAEFQPPLSGYLMTPAIEAFVALAALTALALAADAPRVRPFDLLATVATFYLACRARRNIPIFAIAAVPVLLRSGASAAARFAATVEEIVDLWRWTNPASAARWRAGARAVTSAWRAAGGAATALALVGLGLTYDVVSNRFFLRSPTERWWGSGTIPHYFPDEAARFVDASGIPGQVFHPLAGGGFLIHAWGGQRKVFIDGRNDPYLDGVLEAYLKAIAEPSAFEDLVRRYQITTVLWPHQRALEAKPLLAYLARGKGWILVHLDPGASVYLRADVPFPALLAAAPFRAGRERAEVYGDLERGLLDRPFSGPPIREIALAEFLSVSGDPRGAEIFYRRALDHLPGGSAAVLHDYALALERQGRVAEARAAHEAALRVDPGFLPSVVSIGAFLLDEGKLDEARRWLGRAYRGGERGVLLMTARARLLDREGKPAEAVAAYQEALRGAPRNTTLLRDVGSFYARHDQPEAALGFYAEAAAADPDDPRTAREMAGLLRMLGRPGAALDVARDAARRVVETIEAGRTAGEDDRQVVMIAARLEARAGNRDRAAGLIAILARAGLLEEAEVRGDPDLRTLPAPGGAAPP